MQPLFCGEHEPLLQEQSKQEELAKAELACHKHAQRQDDDFGVEHGGYCSPSHVLPEGILQHTGIVSLTVLLGENAALDDALFHQE